MANEIRQEISQCLPDRLAPITLPDNTNYIAVFLTLSCNLSCSYCINRFGDLAAPRRMLTGEDWVRGLNRIVASASLPITLQGGEPTLHPDFFSLVNGIRPDLPIDLLTNLHFDINRFMGTIGPQRLTRPSPYASIRVSYHPEVMRIKPLADKVLAFLEKGYSIGIWGVLHPQWQDEILRAQEYCRSLGIDFRTKEYLGMHNGIMYGAYSYPGACDRNERKTVRCRTTELIIGPRGDVYRCHGDLYEGRIPIGHILDADFSISDCFRMCDVFGYCNPCDVKLKTNRFQRFGHTSVQIVPDREKKRAGT